MSWRVNWWWNRKVWLAEKLNIDMIRVEWQDDMVKWQRFNKEKQYGGTVWSNVEWTEESKSVRKNGMQSAWVWERKLSTAVLLKLESVERSAMNS